MGRSVCLVACLLASLCILIQASPVFNARDVSRVSALLASRQQADGSFGSLRATRQAVSSLHEMHATIPQTSNICRLASSALNAEKLVLEQVHDALQILVLAKCDFKPLNAKATEIVKAGLQSEELADLYYAVESIFALTSAKKAVVTDFDFSGVAIKIADMADDDGLYRSGPMDEEADVVSAGLALQVLAKLYTNLHEFDKTLEETMKPTMEKLEHLMNENQEYKQELIAGAELLDGMDEMARAVSHQPEIKETNVDALCAMFVKNKYTASLEELAALTKALSLCANNPVHVPLVMDIRAGSDKLRVTNVLDRFAVKCKVLLRADIDAAASELQPATKDAENVLYQLPKALSLTPGRTHVYVTVEPESEDERFHGFEKRALPMLMTAKAAFTKFELIPTDTSKLAAVDEKDVHRCVSPKPFSDLIVVPATKSFVHMKLFLSGVEKIVPSQVFLQVTSVQNEKRFAVFPAAQSADASHFYLKLDLNSMELAERLAVVTKGTVVSAAKYKFEWLVGDAALEKPLSWNVGVVEMTLAQLPKTAEKTKLATPEAAQKASSAVGELKKVVAAAQAAEEDLFAGKPEIHHVFRQPDERPPAIVGVGFAALCLLPLGYLLVQLLRSDWKLKLPTDPTELLWAVAFQGVLLAILLLYVLYWLKLNIFQALTGVCILGVLAVFTGNRALKALHARREGKTAASSAGAAGDEKEEKKVKS